MTRHQTPPLTYPLSPSPRTLNSYPFRSPFYCHLIAMVTTYVQGIEEMRVIRLPYAGLAPQGFNDSDPESKSTTDFTLHTSACMRVRSLIMYYDRDYYASYVSLFLMLLCFLYFLL